MASALKISAMLENTIPTKPNSGQASSNMGLWLMSSASITSKITLMVNSDLKAAQSISAISTSSS